MTSGQTQLTSDEKPVAKLVVEEKLTATTDKTFVYCSESNPTTFSPQVAYDTSTFTVVRSVFNRLVDFEQGSTKGPVRTQILTARLLVPMLG